MCFLYNPSSYDFNKITITKHNDLQYHDIKTLLHLPGLNSNDAILCQVDNQGQSPKPNLISHAPLYKGQKNGWCIEYHRSGAKKNEGWYVDGKKHGYHRIYKLHMTRDGEKHYLYQEKQYVNGVEHGISTIYDRDEITSVSTYVNGLIHGFVEVPRARAVQLWINGNMTLADIHELGIQDHKNLSESELFTLQVMGL